MTKETSGGDDRLWAFDRCTAYPLPDNRMLVRNPRTARHALITPDVYGALQQCREFRTLGDHARHIATRFKGLAGQEAMVRQVLDSVRNDGLLIAADIYATTLAPTIHGEGLPDRPVVAIITWERPESLEQCLTSVQTNCDLAGIERLYVIDDSRDPAVRERNHATTAAFAETAATTVAYFGHEAQVAFMDALIAQVPALEAQVRFLVDRDRWGAYWTSGLARTVALLLSVGHRLIVLDDDIVCRVHEPPHRETGASFAFTNREAAFYGDNAEWAGLAADDDPDPLARHARFLGLGLSDALGALGIGELSPDSFAGADVDFMEGLRPDSPVLVSECGSLGDSGAARMQWITGLTGKSRAELLQSEERVQHALSLRRSWTGRSRPTFAPRSNISQLTGLDNRRLLPPYIPIMRGEDRLFGDMVRFVHPAAVALDHAWCVPHLPQPERKWSDRDRALDVAQPFPAFSLVLDEDELPPCHATKPLHRLAALGAWYAELSQLDHEALARRWTEKRLQAKVELYGHLQIVLAETTDAPANWRSWIEQGIARLDRALMDNPLTPVVKGYPEDLQNERLTGWWQDFWREFGHALRAWPEIRMAARQVNERSFPQRRG